MCPLSEADIIFSGRFSIKISGLRFIFFGRRLYRPKVL
nr:MAG TPA: hypothetical protein [Caudoviricetes sp.]